MPLLFINNWFDNAFIQALGWTLFHSLWQGFLLVVLVALAILVTRRSTATIRYRLFSGLFFLFIGCTVCTFLIEYSSLRPIPTPILLTGNEVGDTLTLSTITHTAAVDLKVPLPGRLAFYFNEYGPWLMMLWFIIFMLKSIRLGINYAQVQRIRNENRYVLPAIEKRVNELAKLLRIRRTVKLRETTSISVPVTMGFLKPLILIPCGLINNLPPDQVEAILLHELAHIRRLDYLVNLLQCLAETVFFFNPAVLWLSSLLREERENCCDDIAITVTQNKSLFIHALVAFQEYHVGHPMAPGLQGNKYPLLKRIQRIVYNNNKKLNHMEKIFLALGLVVTGIVALAFNSPSTHPKEKPAKVAVEQKFHSATVDSLPEENLNKQLQLRDNHSRLAKKRNDEAILLDKMTSENNDAYQLKVLELKAAQDNQRKLLRDNAEENELFDQKKKIELQDKFLNDLQNDNNKKLLLLKENQDNSDKLLFKQKDDNDRLFKQKLDGLFKEEDSQKLHQLQEEKMKLELDLNVWMGKPGDTLKPRNRKIKEKTDDNDDEFERKQRSIEAKKRDMEAEMRSKEKDDYNERLKEMADYRAMLQKELRQTEKQIDREKKNAEKARKEDKEDREEREEMEEREENKNRNENKDRNEKYRIDTKIDSRVSKSRPDVRIEENRSISRRDVRIEENDDKAKMDLKIEERARKNRENSEKAKERTLERKAEMEERMKEARKEDRERREDMIQELREDGIIGKDVDDVSIQMNDDGMTVNGVKQPEKVFNKYREKFRKGSKKPPTSPKPTSSVFPKVTSPVIPKPKLQSVKAS